MPGPSRPGKPHPESGKVSRYELRELLGEASSGPVYKAWDPELERSVALRLIPPGLAGQGEDRQQLLREARTVSLLEHPNVCPVYEMGEADDGSLFLVSGYCEGETLAERMQRSPLRPEGAVELAAQIAAAVAQAHEQGIVHGRLRPTNVRIGADGLARVVDFGLSGLEERTWATALDRAAASAMVSEYLAPELLGGEAVSTRSDVWAIGALLFAMMTGKPPSRLGLAGQEPMPATREGMPDDLARILDRALATRPAERHAQAGDLRDDLRGLRRMGSRPSASGASPGARTPGRPPEVAGARRLSQYRIGELLGGGGMGVVYKAEDLQLGRTVALKFLPLELASEPAAKARFLQEARAASALDHPNICTIYEVGETDEHQLYLAMPCYDGETLKARISRGPLPVTEALDCALQVARGLAKAHRQGIVHRDVKPANLMVTADGLVKILDFGVAKLAGEVGLTRTGSTVGTPAYMAPEQIRSEPVDARADLWSLGVVLYEMVTGQRPFPGENQEAVAHAILTREPEPLARLRPDAPAGLERIVGGLLAKDPAQRLPTADAVSADLRLLLGLPPSSVAASALPALLRTPRKSFRVSWRRGLAVALALLAAVALLLRLRDPFAGEETPRQATFSQLTDREGREMFPSLSPDGNYFVYSRLDGGDQDVFLQRVGGGNPINLTAESPADDSQPAYSPDGQWIAFRSERGGGGLFIMGATGESVRRITDFGFQPSWSPDSRELAFSTEAVTDPMARSTLRQAWRVEVATGRRRMVAKGDAAQPSWSPGGYRIALWGIDDDRWRLWTLPADGGTLTPVLDADEKTNPWSPVWSPDGRHLYFLSNRGGSVNLWRLPIDERSGRALGEAEPVTTPAQSVSAFSLSRDGRRILYSTRETRSIVESVGFDPGTGRTEGSPRTVARLMRKVSVVEPSPRGDWLVMAGEAPAGEDLFVMHPDGSGLRQLTDDPHHDRFPDWSADGRRIFFFTDRSGRLQIWTVQPDGGGLRAVITRPKAEPFNPHPSPDGRWLACNLGFEGVVLFDLLQPLKPPVPLAIRGKEDHILVASSWSADGAELAGQFAPRKVLQDLGSSGSMAVYSLASKSVEVLPAAGEWPRFVGDGRILLFYRDGAIHAIDRRSRRSWKVAAPPEGSVFNYVAPARDARTLYTVRTLSEGDVWLMDQRSP
ncbi:MAG TPA: protein kinase [Thermoanaerobaculia bacterium]|nr:protein kinase [Thermoanaerobaculia bacterium]